MAKADDALVQQGTRIPQALLQCVKIHCVERDKTMMAFVIAALGEKLRRARIRRV